MRKPFPGISKWKSLGLITTALAFLLACGGGGSSSGGGDDSNSDDSLHIEYNYIISGKWVGRFYFSKANCGGAVEFIINQANTSGRNLWGTSTRYACRPVEDASFQETVKFTGTISVGQIDLVDEDGTTFKLTYENSPESINGTIQNPDGKIIDLKRERYLRIER